MAKIEVGKYSDLLRRLFSMSGVVEVAQELAPEISPVFILESERPEWEFIKGAKLCTSQFTVVGAPALQATARLRNPVGSGVIAIIDQVFVSVPTGVVNPTVLFYRVETNANLLTLVTTMCRDTRFPAANVSALIASMDNVAAAGDFFYNAYIASDAWPVPIRIPFVLTPGFAMDVNLENTNIAMRGCVQYLERRIGELEVAT